MDTSKTSREDRESRTAVQIIHTILLLLFIFPYSRLAEYSPVLILGEGIFCWHRKLTRSREHGGDDLARSLIRKSSRRYVNFPGCKISKSRYALPSDD